MIIMNNIYSENEWINIKNIMDEKIENGFDIDIEFYINNDLIKFNLNINSGLSTLIISKDDFNNVNTLFLDFLPYINILEFRSTSHGLEYLENKLQNLPITILFIKFNLTNLFYIDIAVSPGLKFLFNIKKPFGCKIILNIKTYPNTRYNSQHIDNEPYIIYVLLPLKT